jgi:signal transduction histidine kinase
VIRVLTRPLRRETWLETSFLLLGLPTSVTAFVVLVAGVTLGGIFAITIVGLPVLLGLLLAARALAHAERWRAGLVFGRIHASYRAADNPGFWSRIKTIGFDPASWRDLLWLVILTPIGFGEALLALCLWGAVAWALTLPIYWHFLHASARPQLGDGWTIDSWHRALLIAAGGLVAMIPVAWIVAGLARTQALVARALLGPRKSAVLEVRVDELARTRAAAADAQTEELRRIERDLHDGAQARLVALAIDLGLAREKLDEEPEAARALLENAHSDAKAALEELRELVRGVHPAVLADRGLDGALAALAARSPVPVGLDLEPIGPRLAPAVEAAAYFVVAEGLTNVAKHSQATRATVRVSRRDGTLAIEIADDGVGGADAVRGSGITGLASRVHALDGTLTVSSPAGGPTTLRAELPCES